MRALSAAGEGLAPVPVAQGLNIVYALAVRHISSEDRETLDGWMTCTVPQALEFIEREARADTADRLRVARIAGVVG